MLRPLFGQLLDPRLATQSRARMRQFPQCTASEHQIDIYLERFGRFYEDRIYLPMYILRQLNDLTVLRTPGDPPCSPT